MVRLVLAACIPVLAACGGGSNTSNPTATDQVQVIATNSVLADLARNVAGDDAEVRTLVPAGVDLLLLAPRLPGRYVRERFTAGGGVPAYVDVGHDATGRAWGRVLALAKGIGATRVGALAVTFEQETELDLFSEHFTFPLIFRVLEVAFDEMVAQGYPAEAALMELHGSGELGEILTEAARVGLYRMLERDGSPACRFGVLQSRRDLLDVEETRELMRGVLARIRDGSFARDLLEDQRIGHLRLEHMTEESHRLPVSEAEGKLRGLLRR